MPKNQRPDAAPPHFVAASEDAKRRFTTPQSETQVQELFENHAAAMLLVDVESESIVDANQPASKLYGLPVEQLRSMKIGELDASSPPRPARWLAELAARSAGCFSSTHQGADGTLRSAEICYSVILRQGKRTLFCIMRDNSERHHFEALTNFRLRLLELSEHASAESLLTMTLDEAERLTASRIGFFNFIADRQTVLRYACSSMAKTDNCGHGRHPIPIDFALSSDVIIEQRAVIHNDFATLKHCNCTRSHHQRGKRELIVPIIRNGTVVATMEIGNKPTEYTEADVRLVSMVAGVAWDIVARKHAEESEHKMQEALHYTQKMELIGQLAGGMAHNINNALTSVLGYADLLIEEFKSSHQDTRHLQKITDSTIRAANLIEQLLAFARKQTMQPEQLTVDTALCKKLPMLQELVGNKSAFTCQTAAQEAKILMDPGQLDQIVTNLCANALDAIGEDGQVMLETSLVRVEPFDCQQGHPCQMPGDYVAISVSDNGSGIEPKVRPHIFEPFFTTREIGKGSGLGLSTVYGIVKQNKGYLDCQSTPGKGSCLTVYLPLFENVTELQDQKNAQKAPDEPTALNRQKTVLLINPDPGMVQLIKKVLEQNGFALFSASTPDEGLELAARQEGVSIDLLLADVLLPEMNGRALASRLRLLHPKMKTLFMSAYTMENKTGAEVKNAGTQFIRKPFKLNELTVKVRAMLT